MKRQYLTLGLVMVFVLSWPLAASAAAGSMNANAYARKEISTAQAHAVMAAHADSLKMVHAHLQHVINCLVGPDGKGFDASAMNPCKGMGHGALADTYDHHKLHSLLSKALETAQKGLEADKMEKAHKAAKKTASLLKEAQTDDYTFDA